MTSIVIPDNTFIVLLYRVRYLINVILAAVETSENINKGKAIPMPKDRKFSTLPRKLTADIVLAKRAAINKGLQGTAMAPKKKPYAKVIKSGFLATGAWTVGRNLLISILKINNKLMIINMPNAAGDTTPITLVSDTCRTVVNINPSKTMNKITPEVTINPKKAIVFLSDPLCN